MNYYGYIEKPIEPEHWILGASSLPQTILRKDGQWLDYIPQGEPQKRLIETFNCTGFNTLRPVAILMWEQFGAQRNYSERFLGIVAGTYPPGNDAQTVAEALRKNGCIKEELLPFDDTIDSVDKYYSPKPPTKDLLQEGKNWLVQYGFGHEWVFTSVHSQAERIQRLKQALQYSPLGTGVYAWKQNDKGLYVNLDNEQNNHWTNIVGYKEGEYWIVADSYAPYEKHLDWNYPFGSTKRYSLVYLTGQVNDVVKKTTTLLTSEITTIQKVGVLEQVINFLKEYLSYIQALLK